MNILILGAEGVIGKCLTKYLSNYFNVIPWDIKLSKDHDLRKEGCIDNVLKTVDFVVFLAFDVGGSKYDVNNKEFLDNNMKLILYTFDSLSKNPKPFIYTTSQMSNMITNPYGSLKNISEYYVTFLNGVNLKLWNVYGEESVNEKSHVITDFINSAVNDNVIKMLSYGSDERQFLHVDDFSKAIKIIIDNYNVYIGKNIDISSYEWVSIFEVAEIIKDVCYDCNLHIKIERGPVYDNHTIRNEPSRSILNDMWRTECQLKCKIAEMVKQKI